MVTVRPRSDRVRVRLVPRNAAGESFARNLTEVTPQVAKRYAPDSGRARAAYTATFALGIESFISHRNTLEGFVPFDLFEATFGTRLTETRRPQSDFMERELGAGDYLAPEAELTVPDELSAAIAFAYVPTPPVFFAPTLIPPNVSLYHLRLADVSRILRASLCHRRGWTGRGIGVAMADTGFARHPYFESQGYTIQRVSTATTSHPAVDASGHGTGESANTLVVAPDCRFFGVKHDDYSADALETSLAQNPRVLVNSWGWNIDHQSMSALQASDPNLYNELRDVEQIIADAIDDGVTVIFAGGNGHRAFPASMPDVIAAGGVTVAAAGALKASNYASSFDSQLYPGRHVPDFAGIVGEAGAAPLKGHIMLPVPNGSELEGENLPASKSNKGWGVFSGTSAAAPQTAGVVALMLSANPALTPAEVKDTLADTAQDVLSGTSALGDAAGIGYDAATGSGLIDAFAACLRAEQMSPRDDG